MGRMVPPPAELLLISWDGPSPSAWSRDGTQGVPVLGTGTAPTPALVAHIPWLTPRVTLSSSAR